MMSVLLGFPDRAFAQFTLTAAQTQVPPVIDGVVADGEWNGASLAAAFVQFEPRRGEASPYRTEALVLYDKQHVYVAFRAWDPEPLTAQLTQRDAALDRDDAVGVLLDTFDDRQTAYLFVVNVLGTQADARIADDGRTVDFNWDGPWRAAAGRTPEGWTAELSLPLTSLSSTSRARIAPGASTSYWGIGKAGDLAAAFKRALDRQQQEAPGKGCCSS